MWAQLRILFSPFNPLPCFSILNLSLFPLFHLLLPRFIYFLYLSFSFPPFQEAVRGRKTDLKRLNQNISLTTPSTLFPPATLPLYLQSLMSCPSSAPCLAPLLNCIKKKNPSRNGLPAFLRWLAVQPHCRYLQNWLHIPCRQNAKNND